VKLLSDYLNVVVTIRQRRQRDSSTDGQTTFSQQHRTTHVRASRSNNEPIDIIKSREKFCTCNTISTQRMAI